LAALRQRVEDDEIVEATAELLRGGERAERRRAFMEVDFRVALVGSDHEAVRVRQRKERLPLASDITLPAGLPGEQTTTRV